MYPINRHLKLSEYFCRCHMFIVFLWLPMVTILITWFPVVTITMVTLDKGVFSDTGGLIMVDII